jgi:hypothetical protein
LTSEVHNSQSSSQHFTRYFTQPWEHEICPMEELSVYSLGIILAWGPKVCTL